MQSVRSEISTVCTLKNAGWTDAGLDTSAAHTDDGPTDGQRAGRKRWCGECGDESEQERSRTGGGAGRREQLAPCPSAGAGTRRQAVEAELRRGRCGGSDVAGTPTQRPRKLSKRGRARYGTHRTGFILAVLRRREGLGGGDV